MDVRLCLILELHDRTMSRDRLGWTRGGRRSVLGILCAICLPKSVYVITSCFLKDRLGVFRSQKGIQFSNRAFLAALQPMEEVSRCFVPSIPFPVDPATPMGRDKTRTQADVV
jgi:hypothetical protein